MPVAFLIPALLALIAGAATALQPPTNAMLARAGGSVVIAALISFAVGTAVLLAATLATRPRAQWAEIAALPWYAWAGGAYGVVFVVLMASVVPRLGAASAITVAIAGQLAAALLVDQLGLFGIARTAIGPARLLGIALVLAGVWLVRRV